MVKKTLKRTRLISLLIIVAMMIGLTVTVLSTSNWTSVGTFAQFKAALENQSVTHIRLTNDIQIIRGGVEINSARSTLTIDGGGYAIHGHNSNLKTDTLRYSRAGALREINVINATIVSHSREGFINVNSGSNWANVQATFRNINFFGPQLISATDSNVTIGSGTYILSPGFCKTVSELAEANHIRLEDNITIHKDSLGKDEIFRIERAGGGITVATGAYVNVSLNQGARKTAKAGFVHFQRTDGYLRFERDSFFNFVGNGFFQQNRDVQEVIIGERAQVHIRTHGNFKGCYGIFMISGRMVVGEDAIVNLIATGNTKKDPVIQLDKKTSTVTINNARQFFVYNSSTKGLKGQAIGTSSCTNVANVFYNNISNVAYWRDNTSPYDNLSPATFSFYNDNRSSFSLFSSSTRSKVNNVGSTDYDGRTPFNTNTALLRDVNVIFIGGGTGNGGIIVPDVHYVSFHSNGGTPVSSQYVYDGDLLDRPEDPHRSNMFFDGWFTDPHFRGQSWDFNRDIVTSDMVLYAKWVFEDGTVLPFVNGADAEEPEAETATTVEPEQEQVYEPVPEEAPADETAPAEEPQTSSEPETQTTPEPVHQPEPQSAPEPAPEPATESEE